ncbi:MAG: glucose-6-phosphate dehydrogenase [Acholeplasmataceae bacterium]
MIKNTIITIFGATGDLTARKLIPAITKLYLDNEISENTLVIALGRRDYNTDSFLTSLSDFNSNVINKDLLSKILFYYKMQITNPDDYNGLKTLINKYKDENTKLIYYLAIGPDLIKGVAKNLSDYNLITKNNPNERIVFEKPFGNNLKSAKEINNMLWQYFTEEQIYRIDHYLGKEMIQNIISVRFANLLFRDSWDSKSIKEIRLVVKEKEGILKRAGYYDHAGALKDMVQSHILQMLSLITMDPPYEYESLYIADEKVKVLKSLTVLPDSVFIGQYDGYLNEENIDKDSKTETFVSFICYVNTPNFREIPIKIFTGKKLSKKESYLEVIYHQTNEQKRWNLKASRNILKISIDPKEKVELLINSKVPGFKDELSQVNLSYKIAESAHGNIPAAYERLILDLINGSKTLFARWDEIEYSWHFIDRIKDCHKNLYIYKNEKDMIDYIKKNTA